MGGEASCFAFYILTFALKKMPTMEIAGLCLPLKPQKEKL